MQNHELKIIKKVITDHLKILTFEGELNKDASDTVELDQQSIRRLSRMDALQQQAMTKAMSMRKQNIKNRLKRLFTECTKATMVTAVIVAKQLNWSVSN